MGKGYTKRSDGRYYTSIGTGIFNKITGKEDRIPVYGKTLDEFNKNIRDIRYNIDRGTYADDKGHTVGTYARLWLEAYKSDTSLSSYQSYSNIIRNHLSDIEDIELMKLTLTDIQLAVNHAKGHYDIQRRIRMTINQMLECAIEDGLVYKNVCRNVKLPQKVKTDKRALTNTEIQAIRSADFTRMEHAFVSCLYYLGARRGEALSLMSSSFNFQNDVVYINKGLTHDKNQAVLGSTKTVSGERYIDLISPFKDDIKAYVSSLSTPYLFTNKNGGLMSKTSYRRFWDSILLKINTAAGGTSHYDQKTKRWKLDINMVPGLTPHIFRHNYATNLYYAGVDLKEAQRLLGHADAKTVIEIYTHLDSQKSKSKSKIEAYYAAI